MRLELCYILCFLLLGVKCMKKVIYDYNESAETGNENYATVQTMNSTLYKTVIKFYCSIDYYDHEDLLIYGTKSWAFPRQDVNLTLSYPSKSQTEDTSKYRDEYWITGFNVLLFIDNTESQGYINNGGILEDSISLSFISPNVNLLQYQFWLYGVLKSSKKTDPTSGFVKFDLC
ncbi:uncharacterized protein ACR2FA_007555 [Aphomia sociella]